MSCPPRQAPSSGSDTPLLAVDGLRVSVETGRGRAEVLHGASFVIRRGETLALVGESGSGKSLTALSVVQLLPRGVRFESGRITFDGIDVATAAESTRRHLRGARIGFVFQEPTAALSPVYTIGAQVSEILTAHRVAAGPAADARTLALLADVGMPDPQAQARAYPHQLSGGLRQRAMLAIALACRPALLIADEPTTALDATLQAEILSLLQHLRQQFGLSLLLITHDLGVVASIADRVAVMYAGHIVEEAPVAALLAMPRHPYTRALLASIPGGRPHTRLSTLDGTPPAPGEAASPCPFAARCPSRTDVCETQPPPRDVGAQHWVLCHLPAAGDDPTSPTAGVAAAPGRH